ncbi:hypothetical protein AGOR_G00185990 [Albula goreensis]|uniref:Uncharacterized protein n=1 Tax=Albula goreensis TaxID=1534307 RepID=A0A8T3D1J8_9TELE|nr:hypothetical protein AGOR_G00185990 [Albula goreensis]
MGPVQKCLGKAPAGAGPHSGARTGPGKKNPHNLTAHYRTAPRVQDRAVGKGSVLLRRDHRTQAIAWMCKHDSALLSQLLSNGSLLLLISSFNDIAEDLTLQLSSLHKDSAFSSAPAKGTDGDTEQK